jgi:hypothetical protein
MADDGSEANEIGLADFLNDLRSELAIAQDRAANQRLKLGITEITLSLEVAHTLVRSAGANAAVKAKFWVLASAEAGAKADISAHRARTHRLTLTLCPRVEAIELDADGVLRAKAKSVDVHGNLKAREQQPGASPNPPSAS